MPSYPRQLNNDFNDVISQRNNDVIGRVNIGWTIGEELLFIHGDSLREETCFAETESCMLGINK